MANTLFITGSGGFIGRRFLQRLEASNYRTVYCLDLDINRIQGLLSHNGNINIIQADLLDVQKYASQLKECDTVVHFAAATGKKVTKQAYFDVNTLGTTVLVNEAQRVGVKRILYLSTIAVKYTDKSYYYYAQSKEAGEKAVISSGLSYTILRPTIVIGENGPVWNSLARLARFPVIPLFGGGKAKIQPIYLDDFVDLLVEVLEVDNFHNQVLEIGGPEVISFETFLSEIHQSVYGSPGRTLRLPYHLIKRGLAFFEGPFSGILPLSAGQLSAFGNDGSITDNELFIRNAPKMKSIKEMIGLVVVEEKNAEKSEHLERECKAYTRYLIGNEPTAYVTGKYLQAHQLNPALKTDPVNRLDKLLLSFSSKGSFAAQMVDAYANLFFKDSLFRRKIILMMALLESATPFDADFDTPETSSPIGIVSRLGGRGLLFILALSLALAVFIPARIILSRTTKSHDGGG